MKFLFFFLVCMARFSWAVSPDILLQDIVLFRGESLKFANEHLQLEFDVRSGAWRSFSWDGLETIMASDSPPFDILVDNKPVIKDKAIEFRGHAVRVDPQRNGVVLDMMYNLTDGLEITSSFRLFPHSNRLERFATVYNHTDEKLKFWGFIFDVPNVVLGNPQECVLNVPGPWFPKTYIGPNKPYIELVDQSITFHGAPEAGFGFVSLTNINQQAGLATWMDTGGEVNYHPAVIGDGERLTIRLTDNRAYWLQPDMTVDSDPQIIEFTASPTRAMASYRRMVEQTLPLGPAPGWVKQAVILEVYPPYFPEGFKGITKKLNFYRDIGFTCIYLMPHWRGGYSPIDLFKVNLKYGTQKDLQELVKTAHELGLKVLFDMVIHGMNEKSALMAEQPDLFCKNEHGEIVRHPTWRSMTFDWANPDYQQYMVDLVKHDLETYNIDGYRVDAASYKGPNWDPTLPYPAYRSGSAAPELMNKMLNALRSKNPQAVLLSEVFGPAFQNVCNFVHDNQTEACQMLIEKIDAGEATAHTYQQHLENVFSLLPSGANRVIYTRNHDTSWFYHFNGYTPRFLAFEAINALCGIPEIFTGDPKNGPNPDDDPSIWPFYKKLFALRKQHPALVYGTFLPNTVKSSNPMVFAAIKEYRGTRYLILVSLSQEPLTTALTINNFKGVTLVDLDGQSLYQSKPQLTLQPFQILVGHLNE